MSEVYHIEQFSPSKDDKFFLDTNIWMYLYCSIGNYNQSVVEKYNVFFEKILNSNAKIYTTAMQISEFFNTYCKLEYHIAKQTHPELNYKRDFRASEDFIDLVSNLRMIIKHRIFKHAEKIDDKFSNIKIDEVLKNSSYDFNDEYFINLCLQDSIIIVSNDRDMMSHPSGIKIVSNLKQ